MKLARLRGLSRHPDREDFLRSRRRQPRRRAHSKGRGDGNMEKLEKLRELLDEQHIDGLLITNGYNRRYLTGFTGTAGAVLVSRQGAVLVTDFRYVEQASRQAQGFEVVQHSGRSSKKLPIR
ncbi:hypothetical protein I656_04157 [Geobacillus sp. WSUCF1]|nr:hypothetical protein I656_04157 [Geobacillus sp. WSUCF1]